MIDREDFEDILVDDDAAPAAREPKDDPIKARLAEVENELLSLRKQRDESQDEAYKARQEAAEKEMSTALYTASAQKAAVSNALQAREMAISQIQAEIANAVEVADGKRAAELQTKLAEAIHERGTLRHGLSQLDDEIERMKSAPAPKIEKPTKTVDAFEETIANLPPNQREWARQHKDKGYFRAGEGPSPKLLKAYWAAKAEGLDEHSEKFTAYMDRELGHVKGEPAEEMAPDASERFQEDAPEPPKPKPAAKKPVAAAPVSREASNGGIKTARGTFRLTAEQTQTASRMGMTPEEYLAGIQESIKRGKLPASVLQ